MDLGHHFVYAQPSRLEKIGQFSEPSSKKDRPGFLANQSFSSLEEFSVGENVHDLKPIANHDILGLDLLNQIEYPIEFQELYKQEKKNLLEKAKVSFSEASSFYSLF